ncbi:uncharacterized protein LOC126555863 [Aphis gossypii]|uniref:uncharacterized protein LOC126555863 n=1 Tax=Aphis gossypii TaxID=80765 RepID=UPI002159A483|nr:uncharacterized protein LOC126555863 [Aphis gossypii]
MKLWKLFFAIFVALSLQTTRGNVQGLPCLTCPNATNTINKTKINITNTVDNVSYFFGNDTYQSQLGTREIAVGSLDSLRESKADLSEGRGKKKKKKKIKNSSMNIMVGGSIMAAFVVIFMFLNMITATLGKALLFTFIAKFLVSVNWKSSESSKKKPSHNDITVLMT